MLGYTRYMAQAYIIKVIPRFYSGGASQGSVTSPSTGKQTNFDVPGLSSAVIHPATEPVGPGVKPDKSSAYKSPEYFCYNNMSYFEAEIEMAKYRCPQPSALKK